MSETRYSLCIAEIDFNTNEIRNKVWRIADYDFENQCFVSAKYNENDEMRTIENYNPYKIRAFTNTLTAYKAEIRSWIAIVGLNNTSGETYITTESNPQGESPIEIIFLPQIDLKNYNSDSSIRCILQNGFTLPAHTSDNFFIITNKLGDAYEALLCNRKDLLNHVTSDIWKIQKHCQDMLRTTHSLNLYIINMGEIFNTEHCIMFVNQYDKTPIRYFYKYLVANHAERKFVLREPEDYAKAYISKYIKNKKEILKISNADAQKWSAMIDTALTNKNELEGFFDATGFKFSDVESALNDLADEIKEQYLQDDAFSQIVERSLLKDLDILESCKVEAKKIWLNEQDTERDRIIAQTHVLQNELNTIIMQKENLMKEVSGLQDKGKKLHNECVEIEAKYKSLEIKESKIKADVQSELKRFQEDVVHLAAVAGFATANLGATSGISAPISFQPEIERKVLGSSMDEIGDFIDDLQDNLTAYGMINAPSYDFSLFLTSVILAKEQIIVCGYQADEIGNAISLLVKGELATQVFLPMGYSDINGLVQSINNSISKVFVIHNALETFSDSIFLALVKYCKDNILLFACEDDEIYRHFPPRWGNYAAFIYTNFIWGQPNDDDLRSGDFDIWRVTLPYTSAKSELLIQATEHKLIQPTQINQLIKLSSIYKGLNSNADMASFPLLCNIVSLSCNKEEMCELIEKTVLDENTVQILKDEFIHE